MNRPAMQSRMEHLESRRMLAAIEGLTPAQVRHAYGFDQLSFVQVKYKTGPHGRRIAVSTPMAADGSGQTIAIVDAFRDPSIQNDLIVFSQQFGLPLKDAYGKPTLTIATPQGKPPVNSIWASEIALDVEWAHAIAPKAHILLVEAKSDADADLLSAIDYARRQKGVVAVSMSWGGNASPFNTANNQILTTPPRHIGGFGRPGGVSYITSSGDNSAGALWPASSPNVLTVGGTTLAVDTQGNWLDEVGWAGLGGVGSTPLETLTTPDIAYNADPNHGFAVYDSTLDQGVVGWQVLGGTSAGAPQWAALIALADQGRGYAGKPSLDGLTQTHAAIHSFPADHFHDILTGSNGTAFAGVGYDLLTGRGSPKAELIVRDLINY